MQNKTIVNMVEGEEIKALENIVKENPLSIDNAPGVLAKAKLKLEFWTELLPEALNKTIGAGTYNKLSQLIKEMEQEVATHG